MIKKKKVYSDLTILGETDIYVLHTKKKCILLHCRPNLNLSTVSCGQDMAAALVGPQSLMLHTKAGTINRIID